MFDQLLRDMRDQQLSIEEEMAAAGINPLRITWTYSSEEVGDTIRFTATPRLKSDEEMIGRCSDPSCCGATPTRGRER